MEKFLRRFHYFNCIDISMNKICSESKQPISFSYSQFSFSVVNLLNFKLWIFHRSRMPITIFSSWFNLTIHSTKTIILSYFHLRFTSYNTASISKILLSLSAKYHSRSFSTRDQTFFPPQKCTKETFRKERKRNETKQNEKAGKLEGSTWRGIRACVQTGELIGAIGASNSRRFRLWNNEQKGYFPSDLEPHEGRAKTAVVRWLLPE